MTAKDTACGVAEAVTMQAPDLPFRLTGSQAKTAFAIRENCEAMIAGKAPCVLVPAREEDGKKIPAHFVCKRPEFLKVTGFLTLTVGDYVCRQHGKQKPDKHERHDICPCCGNRMQFQQVFDPAEASRRFNNLNRRVLKELFLRAIVVTERHKNRAIHFHLVGVLRGVEDIRTGFDFAAFDKAKAARASGRVDWDAERRYKIAAGDALREKWAMLREKLPDYGFGRAELTPIKKTGEAVACYISKYIEKNICNRLKEDKRKKLVRYIGEWQSVKALDDGGLVTKIGREIAPANCPAPHKIKPNDFAWASRRATAWRGKARETAGLIGCLSPEDCRAALGPRWAYWLSTTWQGRTPDDLSPFLIADWPTRRLLTNDLAQLSRKLVPGWLADAEKPMESFLPENYFPGWPEIYRQPKSEMPITQDDAEFAEVLEKGMEAWRKFNRERLEKIAAENALN